MVELTAVQASFAEVTAEDPEGSLTAIELTAVEATFAEVTAVELAPVLC